MSLDPELYLLRAKNQARAFELEPRLVPTPVATQEILIIGA